ncbi:MAG: class IV adenylate cyclase [Patescibacteria group bacterium]
MKNNNIEIEARFLDIDIKKVHKKILEIGGKDLGEDLFTEVILYDKELTWKDQIKFFRIRYSKNGTFLALKHFQYGKKLHGAAKPVVKEIELKVDDPEKTKAMLEDAGFISYREQEKKRHSYELGDIILAVDTWPSTPPYLEIEGDSEKKIQEVAEKLGFKWEDAVFRGAGYIIEMYLPVTVRNLRYLTFSKIE